MRAPVISASFSSAWSFGFRRPRAQVIRQRGLRADGRQFASGGLWSHSEDAALSHAYFVRCTGLLVGAP